MSTYVAVTGTKYYNKDEIASIIDIWKNIFPEKIEEKYVELANLLFQYRDEALKLLHSNRDINATSNKITSINNIINQTDNHINEMINMFLAIKNKNQSGDILSDDIKALANQFDIVLGGLTTKTAQKKEQMEQTYDEKRFDAGNAHSAIESLITQIQVKLQEIDSLSVNGEDRLDRIQVNNKRHLSKIDNIQGLSPQVKETLKNLLQAYSNMIVSSFASVIEQSYEICSAYKDREIINYGKQNDPRVSKQTLIGFSLITLENDFMDNLAHLMLNNSTDLERFNVERDNNFSKVMDLYVSYFNGKSKSIDISSIDALTQNNSHYINLDSLITLRNVVYQEQAQILNDGYHK